MKITLLKLHTHAGKCLQPGATLELPDDQANWLIDAGVAKKSKPQSAAITEINNEEQTCQD